jgi:outer membrane biosynthesis protein TonB
MSRTKMVFSTRWFGALVILLLLTALALGACGGSAPEPTTAPEPTEVAAQPTTAPTEPPLPTEEPTEPPPTEAPTEPPPTEAPTEAPTEVPPTATPTEEPTPEVVDDTACIACHTDQETLMAVAEEEEVPEVESEGEG